MSITYDFTIVSDTLVSGIALVQAQNEDVELPTMSWASRPSLMGLHQSGKIQSVTLSLTLLRSLSCTYI